MGTQQAAGEGSVSRRPSTRGSSVRQNGNDGRSSDDLDDVLDFDPTANFPQWSRSLLLLLDYAIIEGLQRELHTFVHHLKMAESALNNAASEEEQKARRAKSH